MGRLFFCLSASALGVMAAASLALDFIFYVKPGEGYGRKARMRSFWPVHLFLTVFIVADFFIGDWRLCLYLLSFQLAFSVQMSMALQWLPHGSLFGKFFAVLFVVMTCSLLVLFLFILMGHGGNDLAFVWKYYYYGFSSLSVSGYFYCSFRYVSRVYRESSPMVIARGTVSLSIFMCNMAVTGLFFSCPCTATAVACSAFSFISIAYMHLCRMEQDDLYLLKTLKDTVSKSVSRSLFDAVPPNGAGNAAPQQYMYDLELKEKFEKYFETEKPYLNPDLSLNDAAGALCTNKTYLSRMLNGGMGMNFNQVVNKYRITYCMELFVKNPYMKVADLADACGFRSVSTFSLAFRLNNGEPPGDWCRKVRNRLRQSSREPVVIRD